MDWSEILAGAFPAPRDDEPSSLRQDIADELADHLQSAFHRQLLTTPDAERARAKVLDRFGDPQEVARQLWFDALKEKIVSQRMTLALTAGMAVICVAAIVAIWFIVEQGRSATLALVADQRAELELSRAENQALQAQLEKLASAPQPTIDWKPPLKVRVVFAREGGPPAEGLAVSIQQQLLRSQSPETVAEQKTGPDGTADFGPFRPGTYLVNVRTSWKEASTASIEHHPGETHIEEVICPESPPFVETDVRAEVDWPDDLRNKQLWLICYFHSKYDDFETRMIAGQNWTSPPNSAGRPNYLVLPPGGGMIGFTVDWSREPYFPNSPYEPFHVTGAFMGRGGQFKTDGTAIMEHGLRVDLKASPRQYFFGIDDLPATPKVRWPAAAYRLTQVVVATNPAEGPAGSIRRLNVFGGLQAEHRAEDDGPRGARGGGRGATMRAPLRGRGDRGENDDRDSLRPRFVTIKPDDEPQFDAVVGKTNEWKVTLPEELLAILRERLVQ
jgi:hypothetical protein